MSAPFKYHVLQDGGQWRVFVVHDQSPDWWRLVATFTGENRAQSYAEIENDCADDEDLRPLHGDTERAPNDLPASPPSKIVAENFRPAPPAEPPVEPTPIVVALPDAAKDLQVTRDDAPSTPKAVAAEDGEVDGVWLSAQQRTIYDAIVSAAENGAVTPLNSDLARLIDRDYDSAACSVSNVLEKKGLIIREGSLGDRIFIIAKTGKRTTARGNWSRVALEKQTAETNVPPQGVTNANSAAKNEPKTQTAVVATAFNQFRPFKRGPLPPVAPVKFETVDQFVSRGGSINKLPSPKQPAPAFVLPSEEDEEFQGPVQRRCQACRSVFPSRSTSDLTCPKCVDKSGSAA